MKNKDQARQSSALFPCLLAAAISSALVLAVALINRFVYPLNKDMLTPFISEIVLLLFPILLTLSLTEQRKGGPLFKEAGFSKLHAEYIFFIIYAALFAITTSLIFNLLLGISSGADGFTLLGIFTAGEGGNDTSYFYIIAVFALFPALIEEFIFRGILFSSLKDTGPLLSALISALLSSFFGFSLGGFVSNLICGLILAFVRYTSSALQSCILIRFAMNMFTLFIGTNIYRYYPTGQKGLLWLVAVLAWLFCALLFFSESAKIFRQRAKEQNKASVPLLDKKGIQSGLSDIFSDKRNIIALLITILCCSAVTFIK